MLFFFDLDSGSIGQIYHSNTLKQEELIKETIKCIINVVFYFNLFLISYK